MTRPITTVLLALVCSLFVLLSSAAAVPPTRVRRMTNAERFARNLPPSPPKRFLSTVTGTPTVPAKRQLASAVYSTELPTRIIPFYCPTTGNSYAECCYLVQNGEGLGCDPAPVNPSPGSNEQVGNYCPYNYPVCCTFNQPNTLTGKYEGCVTGSQTPLY